MNSNFEETQNSSAEFGHDRSQYYLGLCYANGQGVSQDQDKATEYFKRAAAQGIKED